MGMTLVELCCRTRCSLIQVENTCLGKTHEGREEVDRHRLWGFIPLRHTPALAVTPQPCPVV